MENDKENLENEIKKLEEEINSPDFWNDKNKAQNILRELATLKEKKEGAGKYDKGTAIITIISGAGGDDSEDFAAMLFRMYERYAKKQGWGVSFLSEHKNDNGGYKNISFEIFDPKTPSAFSTSPLVRGRLGRGQERSGPYGLLKNESGVHRLVRISPFNAKKLRHTSFALVEVLPQFSKLEERDIALPPQDLKIEFARSSGPGGQNVNKRETSVRIIHIPTNIAVHVSTERSQEQNRELALAILRAKIFKKAEAEKKSIEESMKQTKDTNIEWGNQIRSYVLHPYKMVKDHRTDAETSNVEAVLNGDLELFIEAEKNL